MPPSAPSDSGPLPIFDAPSGRMPLPRLQALALTAGLALALAAGSAQAQSEGLLTIEGETERFLLRMHAAGHLPWLDVGALPHAAAVAQAALDSLTGAPLSPVDRALVQTYRGERVGGVFGAWAARQRWAFPDGQAILGASGDGYGLTAEPALLLAAGPALVDRPAGEERGATVLYQLSRGVRAAGHAGRLFAEATITENQVVAPLGTREFRNAPRLGYTVTTGSPDPVYDYLVSRGVVGYRDRFLEVRAGRDRNRWGFARGALLLSNYASEYDHAQVRLTAGPVSVQSLYARFLDPRPAGVGDASGVVSKRYGAFHRAAVRLGSVELEAFESVILGDREGDNRDGFELSYLVPFVLFRAAERDLGSPDNVLLGAGAAWRPTPGLRVYGQGLLDELTADRFFEDFWTNKWAFVLGLESADPGLPGLGRLRDTDLRVELARLRPFLYSHRSPATAAIHYDDGLGHPAGPNAIDLSLTVAHRPTPDLEVSLDGWATVRGRNPDSLNVGAEPRLPFTTRASDTAATLQGVRQRELGADLRASLRLVPGLYGAVAVRGFLRDDALDGTDAVVGVQGVLRWALAPPSRRY